MGKENKTIYAVLGLLSHEDMTGYEIKKRIDSTLSFFWNAGFGQIYPTLSFMEKEELVIRKDSPSRGKRQRVIYSITEEGRKELKHWLVRPVENEYVKYEILLKLFFGSVLDKQENISNIEVFREKYANQLAVLQGFSKELRNIKGENLDHTYYLLTVIFGEKLYKAYLDWAEEAVDILRKL